MKKCLLLTFCLMVGLWGNVWGQSETGKVRQVAGDLVYVNGLNGSTRMGSQLQVVNGGQQGAKLQVIKVLGRMIVARVIEANGIPVEQNNEVVVAESNGRPQPRRLAQALRVEKGPRLDGRLDDAVWQQAPPVEGFMQRDPAYWMPISERTVARVVYDNEKIYFGFDCYMSDPNGVIAKNMRRDAQLTGDDHVQILLDPFNDKQNGVFFIVNALGARNDALLSNEGRTTNEDWDCIWEARTTRHEKGWTAEVAIPFDQLRFNESQDMEWGINLGRFIASKTEETALLVGRYTASPRRKYQMSDLGSLRGLKAVKRKRLLQVKPYVLPGTAKNFTTANPAEEETFETGVDVRYGITPNLALDLSYNTDFAQVEADQEQVNLTQFSQFFPEKREFFLEGDQYNRAGGIDFSFSPSRRLNFQGFYARTWDSNQSDVDDARFVTMDYSGSFFNSRVGYMDVEDNFEPEVGFVNRRRGLRAFRRYDGQFFVIPRPKNSDIRNFRIGPTVQLITDEHNDVQFWRARFDAVMAFFTQDRMQARFEQTHDVISRTFRPSRRRQDVFVPVGEYTFTTFRLSSNTNRSRPLYVSFFLEGGTYYNGERYRFNVESAYRPSGRFSIETILDANFIWLPEGGKVNIQTLSNRLLYSLSTDFFVKVFAQVNNDRELVGANFLLNYRFRPGSDLFLVYDHGFDSADGLNQTNRAVLVKLSYLIGL